MSKLKFERYFIQIACSPKSPYKNIIIALDDKDSTSFGPPFTPMFIFQYVIMAALAFADGVAGFAFLVAGVGRLMLVAKGTGAFAHSWLSYSIPDFHSFTKGIWNHC